MRYVDLNFETAKITCPSTTVSPHITEDNDSFNLEFEESYHCPWLSTTCYSGTRSLGMMLEPNTSGMKDRSELTVAHMNDTYAYHFGQTRFLGFNMMINNSSSDWPLAGDVYFFQAWQAKNPGVGGVPLTACLLHNTGDTINPLKFIVRAKDDAGSYTVVPSTAISKGKWHSLVFGFTAVSDDQPGTGHIEVWMDGIQVGVLEQDFGYILDPTLGVEDKWMIKCGMYRPMTDTPQNLAMFFDNVRWATTYAEAVS